MNDDQITGIFIASSMILGVAFLLIFDKNLFNGFIKSLLKNPYIFLILMIIMIIARTLHDN